MLTKTIKKDSREDCYFSKNFEFGAVRKSATRMNLKFSNFQTKYKKDDIEWEMDEGNWEEVWEMINSGANVIEKIKYR